MKKTYWWRIAILFIGIIMLVYGYAVVNNKKLGLCKNENGKEICILHYNSYIDSVMFFSLAVILISLILFFITDKIFLKWLCFAVIWILLSIFLIAITPERHAFFNMDPDKETVSIWMGLLFIILSLIQIIWQSWKERKK
ncbi:MAG TPA: hypothetical protein PLB52_02785 [Candidatus Moranbacteria bacterium]|nr:hypothetical protein [Candidatus Moranbacteria bacterium]